MGIARIGNHHKNHHEHHEYQYKSPFEFPIPPIFQYIVPQILFLARLWSRALYLRFSLTNSLIH